MEKCVKCGKTNEGSMTSSGNDLCACCRKPLCPDCFAKGCCGHKPAKSGMEAYFWCGDE